MKFFFKCLTAFFLVILITGADAITKPLKVGVILGTPFAEIVDKGYEGMVIGLWQNIAAENHWPFQYVPINPDVDQSLLQLAQGKVDIIIGPISVNEQRLMRVDFSRPYFINNIGFITVKKSHHIYGMFRDFLPQTLSIVAFVLLVLFGVYLNGLWYFEHGKHPEVPANYRQAIGKGFLSYLFEGGLTRMPITRRGKAILFVWIISLCTLVSIFNACVSAAFTVGLSRSFDQITTFDDLQSIRVTGVQGHMATQIAQDLGVTVHAEKTLTEAIERLETGKADALVYNVVGAQAYLKAHEPVNLLLSSFVLAQEEYAFALPYHSAITKALNLKIVKFQDNHLVTAICQKYVGKQSKDCQL